MYDRDAEIRKLEIQIEQLQAKLETYESDYRIVVGLKDELLKIFIICENSDYNLECFKLSMLNIKRIQDNVDIDAFHKLYDFVDERVKDKDSISTDNTTLKDYVEQVLITFDNDLYDIGHKIDSLKRDIDYKKFSIECLYKYT